MMVRLMCYDETSNDIPPVGEKTTKPWIRDAAFFVLFCFVFLRLRTKEERFSWCFFQCVTTRVVFLYRVLLGIANYTE